jgi:hypothetical protein
MDSDTTLILTYNAIYSQKKKKPEVPLQFLYKNTTTKDINHMVLLLRCGGIFDDDIH